MLSLTCADIGTDEVEMENHLSTWFRLAEKWGAVMLIDEADVYLEQRSKNDLKRNSLVSGNDYFSINTPLISMSSSNCSDWVVKLTTHSLSSLH